MIPNKNDRGIYDSWSSPYTVFLQEDDGVLGINGDASPAPSELRRFDRDSSAPTFDAFHFQFDEGMGDLLKNQQDRLDETRGC